MVSSIEEIGREPWDACFPGALEGFDYLSAVERSGMAGFDWRYVVVADQGKVIAAAPAFMTDYDLETTLGALGRRLIAQARRLVPRAFVLRLACLGSPCTETVSLGFHPDVGQDRRAELIRAMLRAFEASARAGGCGLLAAKDVPETGQADWDAAAKPLGYRPVPGMPVAYLDIDFPSRAAYLAQLSPGTRRDMSRKLRSLGAIHIEVRDDLRGLEDQVLRLYRDTRARAPQGFEDLNDRYFTGVLEAMGERALCILYFVEGELLAINLLLQDGEVLLDKYFCMESERGPKHNLYFVSWFTNVDLCLARGLARYQSGQAGYANKLRLGSRVMRTNMYFRHRRRLVNAALQLAAPYLSEDPIAEGARS